MKVYMGVANEMISSGLRSRTSYWDNVHAVCVVVSEAPQNAPIRGLTKRAVAVSFLLHEIN